MKHWGWAAASALTLLVSAGPVQADSTKATGTAEPCDDCLICEKISDPASYAEGQMKSLERIVPGKDTWLFRSNFDLQESFGMPAGLEADLPRFIGKLNQGGTDLAIVLQPTRGLVHRDKLRDDTPFNWQAARDSYVAFEAQLRRQGAIVPELVSLIDNPPGFEYFFRRDHHWTPQGARITAGLVAQALKADPVYDRLDAQTEFVSAMSIIIPKDGTMNSALRYLCGNGYGNQHVQGYETSSKEGGDASALFGEAETPEIVLIGSSNSAVRDQQQKHYNFDGFLREYLQADMLNYALQGSGEIGSLQQYLHSSDYDPAAPPKLIIWENPVNYSLSDPLFYRQLIPAISGECSAANTVMQQTASIPVIDPAMEEGQRPRIEALNNSGSKLKSLRNFSGYLDLHFSDPAIKDFYIITYYDNGQRDKVWIRRPNIVDGQQYFLELSRDPQLTSANLLSVLVEPTEGTTQPSEITVKLCK